MARSRPAAALGVVVALAIGGMPTSPAGADDPRPPSQADRPTTPAGRPADPAGGPEAGIDGEAGTPRPGGPIVRSANEAAGLLRAPGDDPYRDPIDWRNVPPWQQTSFYGIRARGSFFVFVVDCSGSMADDLRLVRAKQELRRCIDAMRSPQRHLVVFFNDRPIPMAGGLPRSAERRQKLATFSWLRAIEAEGGTDPRGAMNLALGLRPDAVFLLSDGEFEPGTVEVIADRNRDRIPVHCIDLGGSGAAQLRAIAEESGGQYALRR